MKAEVLIGANIIITVRNKLPGINVRFVMVSRTKAAVVVSGRRKKRIIIKFKEQITRMKSGAFFPGQGSRPLIFTDEGLRVKPP